MNLGMGTNLDINYWIPIRSCKAPSSFHVLPDWFKAIPVLANISIEELAKRSWRQNPINIFWHCPHVEYQIYLSQCVYYVKLNKIQTASFRCANNCRYTRNSLTRNIVALVKVHFRTEQAYTVQITHTVSTNKDVHMWSATFVHEMFYISYVSLMGPDRADPRHHTSTTNITTTNTNSTWAQVMYWSCGKPSHCACCSIEDVTAWEKGSVYRNDLDLQENDVHAL